VHFAHETAGAARIRHSLRPLISEGENYLQTSGAMRRGIIQLCLDHHPVIASEAKQSIARQGKMDCFVASLLAMTAS